MVLPYSAVLPATLRLPDALSILTLAMPLKETPPLTYTLLAITVLTVTLAARILPTWILLYRILAKVIVVLGSGVRLLNSLYIPSLAT